MNKAIVSWARPRTSKGKEGSDSPGKGWGTAARKTWASERTQAGKEKNVGKEGWGNPPQTGKRAGTPEAPPRKGGREGGCVGSRREPTRKWV